MVVVGVLLVVLGAAGFGGYAWWQGYARQHPQLLSDAGLIAMLLDPQEQLDIVWVEPVFDSDGGVGRYGNEYGPGPITRLGHPSGELKRRAMAEPDVVLDWFELEDAGAALTVMAGLQNAIPPEQAWVELLRTTWTLHEDRRVRFAAWGLIEVYWEVGTIQDIGRILGDAELGVRLHARHMLDNRRRVGVEERREIMGILVDHLDEEVEAFRGDLSGRLSFHGEQLGVGRPPVDRDWWRGSEAERAEAVANIQRWWEGVGGGKTE